MRLSPSGKTGAVFGAKLKRDSHTLNLLLPPKSGASMGSGVVTPAQEDEGTNLINISILAVAGIAYRRMVRQLFRDCLVAAVTGDACEIGCSSCCE